MIFSTQGSIDSFFEDYPNCVEINKTVIIGNDSRNNDPITNLRGLRNVKVMSALEITNTSELMTLEGLELLEELQNGLEVSGNDKLESSVHLNPTCRVRGQLWWDNRRLGDLRIPRGDSINYIEIVNNNYSSWNPTALDLSGIQYINEIRIGGSKGHDELIIGGGEIKIIDIEYSNFKRIRSIDKIHNLHTFRVSSSYQLYDLSAFNDLDSMVYLGLGELNIENFESFKNLKHIAWGLYIGELFEVESLRGFENLEFLGELLVLYKNPNLKDISSIGKLWNDIKMVKVLENDSLSDCELLCGRLRIGRLSTEVHDNAKGCRSEEEIRMNCVSATHDWDKNPPFRIVGNELIFSDDFLVNNSGMVRVYNTHGVLIAEYDLVNNLAGIVLTESQLLLVQLKTSKGEMIFKSIYGL